MKAACLLLALAAGPVCAQGGIQPLWELGIGAASLRLPHYRGSAQSHAWLLPLPYAVYRGPILRADRDGARAVLVDTERIDLDLSVGASAPTKSRDNRARSGMTDLAPTLELGPNVNVTLATGNRWKLQARLPVHAVFTLERDARAAGITTSPVLNLDVDVAGWNVGLQGGPMAATKRHHAYFYGVEPAFATAQRPAHDARGGGSGWRATLGVSRRFGEFWFGAFVRADSVAGAVFEASPLVTQRRHAAFGMALSWVFARSQQTVVHGTR